MDSARERRSRFAGNGGRAPGDPDGPPERSADSRAGARHVFDYRLVVFLWFLFLFEPARLITHYIPPLTPLKWIPELLLYAACVRWLFSPAPKKHMPWFTVFFALMLGGTVIAFFSGNWGISRSILRQMFQYYGLGILTFTFCGTPERASTILRMYFYSFLYYAVWGLISLKMAPIASDIDPGVRQIVPWHIHFANRDGFGPYMVMGFAFSFYFLKALRGRMAKLTAAASAILCIVGIVISFGRGVFLAFAAAIGFIWVRTRRKLLTAVALVAITFIFINVFPDIARRYWATMQTISTEGARGGTGLDRKILWGWAWREFLASPIYGVGTGNFGIAIYRVVSYGEAISAGYTPGRLWGRALHCAPMTVLCEYGIIGALAMICLLVDVVRTNGRIRKYAIRFTAPPGEYPSRRNVLSDPSSVIAVSEGLNAVLFTVLISAFFYEILYTPILWHLIVMNRLMYVVALSREPLDEARTA